MNDKELIEFCDYIYTKVNDIVIFCNKENPQAVNYVLREMRSKLREVALAAKHRMEKENAQ